MSQKDPFRQTDDEARDLARKLIFEARYGALAVADAESGAPSVTRVGLVPGEHAPTPFLLVSDLSPHTQALRAEPRCALLIGEPPGKGDPLAFPRITLNTRAAFVDKTAHRRHFLALYPKAQLYFDFADFHLVALEIESALLNGGFGKAYRLTVADFSPWPPAP